jgi:UDP:flavonoid glycosyltransferase YjiC (YdhE family)
VRVLFTPFAWRTHYYQYVGLVWALRAAGHEVCVASQPAVLREVTGTGIMAASVGGRYDFVAGIADAMRIRNGLAAEHGVGGPGGFPPEVLAELLRLRMVPHIRLAEDMAEDLVAFARAWRPDLVISDPLIYAAPLAAADVGAPLIRQLWGPDMSRHVGLPGMGVSATEDPRAAWPEGLVELYEKYGAKPGADVAVCTLDTCPASLQVDGVPNRVAMRYVSYNGAAVIPPWVLEPPAKPRICVTWGSSSTAMAGPEAFAVPRILDGVRDLGLDIVVAIRAADRERLGDVPDGTRLVEEMPLDLILPTCQAIVHQSGAGTTLAAAYFGVPQVTIPQVADQDLVSAQLAGTGAGIGLSAEQADAAGIGAAVSTILSTGDHATAAGRLRAEMLAQPPPTEIIETLEGLA